MNNLSSTNNLINSSIHNSAGLQSLLDEPQRLSTEAERLNEELESLVMDNYKVFVENLTCSVHLRLEDKKLGEISLELENNLNELSQQCISFKDRVNQFVNLHKRNRKTLQHHMQLVELLEVPQLVDSCARNGLHDEALELANFVNGLERRHLLATEVNSLSFSNNNNSTSVIGLNRGSGNDVIQTIVDDVHHTLAGLRQQLLQQLTENTALPKEISILATLRKLDSLLIDRHLSLTLDSTSMSSSSVHSDGNCMENDKPITLQQYREQLRMLFSQNSEIRLQMDFLEARTMWLYRNAEKYLINSNGNVPIDANDSSEYEVGNIKNNATSNATKGNLIDHKSSNLGSYGKVIELLEIRRTAWFTVITQFNALFRDNETALSTSTSLDIHTKNNKTLFSSVSFSPILVLNTWLTNQVSQLLHELKSFLPMIDDGASLRSILEQSLFFASRMGQVNCDFSNLIIPIFHDIMFHRIKYELLQAVEKFKNILLTERISFETDPNSILTKEQLIPIYSAQDINQNNNNDLESTNSLTATSSSSSMIELSAPSLLLSYPPSAYLLNIFLIQLNYIRECPIVTLEQPLLLLIFEIFQDICKYIINHSNEIHKIGEKYYTEKMNKDHHKMKLKNDKKDSNHIWSMEHLYSEVIALEFIPHILLCMDIIFNSNINKIQNKLNIIVKKKQNSMNNTTNIVKDINDNNKTTTQKSLSTTSMNHLQFSYMIKNLWEAKDLFDSDIINELENIYHILIKGDLLNNNVLKKEFSTNVSTTQSSINISSNINSNIISNLSESVLVDDSNNNENMKEIDNN